MEQGMRFRVIGCGVSTILVFVFFVSLLNVANKASKKAKEKQKTITIGSYTATSETAQQDASFDLVQLNDAIRRYASDHKGAFPPMDSAAAFKNALYPKYVLAEDTLANTRDGQGYLPNTAYNGKTRKDIIAPAQTPLLYEATDLPGRKMRLTLMADGKIREFPAP